MYIIVGTNYTRSLTNYTHLTCLLCLWWRHQINRSCALLAYCAGNSPLTGEFPSQKPVTWSFDVFFDLHQNKRLSKPWRRRWLETSSCSWRCHCNAQDRSTPGKSMHANILFDSLAPGRFECNFSLVIFKPILLISGKGIACKKAPTWMSLDFAGGNSTLVQVVAWYRQATSHYLH